MSDAFDLRLKYAAKWDCEGILADLQRVYNTITATERQLGVIGNEMSATRRVRDDMQLTATLSVEGKNVEERKARTTYFLQHDTDYQAVLKHYDALMEQSNNLNVDVSAAGRQVRFLEYRLDHNMAMLRLIGGSV